MMCFEANKVKPTREFTRVKRFTGEPNMSLVDEVMAAIGETVLRSLPLPWRNPWQRRRHDDQTIRKSA
jgi:hypothetical protein